MKTNFRSVLLIDDSEASKQAKRILESNSISPFVVRFSTVPNSFTPPVLITAKGRWEGLEEINRFIVEIEWQSNKQKPRSGLDLMIDDQIKAVGTV